MSEINPSVSGNSSSQNAMAEGAVKSPPSEGEKFQIALPGQTVSSEETEKKSAFSFLQKLVSQEKKETGEKTENIFTKLFGKKDTPETLLSPSFPEAPLRTSVFQKAPMLDEFAEKKKVSKMKTICFVTFVITFLVSGFLYLQLNSEIAILGKTVAKKFNETTKSVIALKTEVNEAKVRLALFHLNRVNLYGDTFLFNRSIVNASQSTVSEKVLAEAKLVSQRQEIKTSLEAMKKALAEPFTVSLFSPEPLSRTDLEKKFEQALADALSARRGTLDRGKPEDAEEIRVISNLMQFAKNTSLRGFLRNLDTASLDDTKIEEAIRKIREKGSNDLSTIAQLKEKRIPWTEVMDRIDQVTKRVDKVYGQGLFEEIGGVRYTNYDFNTKTGQVSLTGQVKTDDSKTFTLIADLIDAFEKSPYFKEVDMRDFTKSQSENFGFGSSLRLQFSLEAITQ